jgi:hypothetical protein
VNLPGLQILEVGKEYFCENPDAETGPDGEPPVERCELLALNPEMTHAYVYFGGDNQGVFAAAQELIQPCAQCGDNPNVCGHGNKPQE